MRSRSLCGVDGAAARIVVGLVALVVAGCGRGKSHPGGSADSRTGALTQLPTAGWVATASVSGGADVPARAIDGNTTTRWTTGASQANGQWFEVDMQSARTFSVVALDTAVDVNEYPRAYQIKVSNDHTTWTTVATGVGTSGSLEAILPVQTARYLQILQTSTTAGVNWSIHELRVYEMTGVERTLLTPVSAWATSAQSGMIPSTTIDGSGLATPTTSSQTQLAQLPKHNEAAGHPGPQMWLSAAPPTVSAPVSIVFDLGSVQTVKTLFIWNYAQVAYVSAGSAGTRLTNRGAKDVKVLASATNPNPAASDLVQTMQFAEANPTPLGFSSNVGGPPSEQLDFNTAPDQYDLTAPVTARYIKFEITSAISSGSIVGLSEVRFATADAPAVTRGVTGVVGTGVMITPQSASASSTLGTQTAATTIDGSNLAFPTSAGITNPALLPKHNGAHGYPAPSMWLSSVAPTPSAPVSITFDLGSARPFNTLFVWNYAQVTYVSSSSPGTSYTNRGAKDVKLYASATSATPGATDYVRSLQLDEARPTQRGYSSNVGGSQSQPLDYNTPAEVQRLGRSITARYVRLEISSNQGGDLVGLSEVRFGDVPLQITPVNAWADGEVAGRPARATIDGSGLAAWMLDDPATLPKHNESPDDPRPSMWMVFGVPTESTPHWITYDLGSVQPIDRLYVWNSAEVNFVTLTSAGNSEADRGAKDVRLYASASNPNPGGAEFVQALQLAQAVPSPQGFSSNVTPSQGKQLDFNTPGATYVLDTPVTARYVKLAITSSWGDDAGVGLSEVRFGYSPVFCAGKTDGTPCNDVNNCTQTDTCLGGVCTGANVVTCTAQDACHVAGVCNPVTGACTNPNAADNTTCTDGNPCTQTDKCQAGVCTGTNPVACPAIDNCHYAGVCSTTTGACVNTAMPDWTACDDTNPCSTRDACMGGTCTAVTWKQCAAKDQCHVAGTCILATGECSDPVGNENASCNDGNACTTASSCVSGVCTGTAQAAPCTQPADTCQVATCDPAATTAYPTNGLAALWHLDDYKDSTENTAHWEPGYSVLPTKVVSGKVGGALAFEGTQYLGGHASWPTEIADAPGFTFLAWVKPNLACPGTYGLFRRDWQFGIKLTCTASGAPGLQVGLNTGAGPFSSLTYSASMGSVPQNQWSLIAMAWDKVEGKIHVYVNAQEVGVVNKPGTLPAGAAYMTLGTADTTFRGTIDEAALYRRALDQPTLAALLVEPTACKTTPKCADPANPCQAATCNAGVCGPPQNRPDTTTCDDGNSCTNGDRCVAGTCTAGTGAPTCTASAACDEATCDPVWKAPAAADVISQWHLDGNLTDPTSGRDLSSTGSVQAVAGRLGQAMHFDSVATSCASRPSIPGEAFTNPAGVTLAAWVNPDANTCPSSVVHNVINRYGEAGLILGCSGSTPVLQGQLNYVTYPGLASVPVGVWSHVALTYRPTTGKLDVFINGARVGSQSLAPNTQVGTGVYGRSAVLYVGCGAGAAIDEGIILRRWSTASEIANMALSPAQCNVHPKTCFPADTCHTTGTCNPGTGLCSNPAKLAGASCSDLSACTTGDTCDGAGACVAGSSISVTCPAAPSQCLKDGVCKADEVPAPPATGRVGWWRFEGDTRDSGGQGLDLVRYGGAISEGRIGRGFEFDGASCMHLPNATTPFEMAGATGISMMAWVKTSPNWTCPSTGNRVIMGKGYDYSLAAACTAGSTPGVTHAFRLQGGTLENFPAMVGSEPSTAWTHVAVTWNGQKIRRYVNGAFVGPERPFVGNPANTDPSFSIGCQTNLQSAIFSSFYKGSIDEAVLYNRPLTDGDISGYFASASAHSCQYDNKDENAPCSDANPCTTEACHLGLCTAGAPVTCPVPDQCHAAVSCSTPSGCPPLPQKADGTPCDDGLAWTHLEACDHGICRVPQGPVNAPVQDLGTLSGNYSIGNSINRLGQVVGTGKVATGMQHAVAWLIAGTTTDIGATSGFPQESTGVAINNTGTMAGTLTEADGAHAYRYKVSEGILQDLGRGGDGSVPTSSPDLRGSYVTAVNDVGELAGVLTEGGTLQGFRYTDGSGFQDIGTLEGGMTRAYAIDGSGRVVGSSWVAGSPPYGLASLGHAVMFEEPLLGVLDLNAFVDPSTGWTLIAASDINGDIVVGPGDVGGIIRPYRLNVRTGVIDDLWGGLQGVTSPAAVNGAGDVVGTWVDPTAAQQAAFVYTDKLGFRKLNDLIDPSAGWDLSSANDISESGEIVGWGYHNGQVSAFRFSGLKSPPLIASSCVGVADDTPCDDANLCTQTSVCEEGRCVGSSPVVCNAPDTCHSASCNPRTGACTVANRDDGARCNDGNPCTQSDLCESGVCVGNVPVQCTAFDVCHLPGTCDQTTGECSNPAKPDPACASFVPPKPYPLSQTTPGLPVQELVGIDGASGTLTVLGAQLVAGVDAPPKTVVVPAMVGSTSSCVGDFNDDGSSDVLFANPVTHAVKWLPRADAQAVAYDQTAIAVVDSGLPAGALSQAVCNDIDHDGDIDVVLPVATSGTTGPSPRLFVYMNQGHGTSFSRLEVAHGFPEGVVISSGALLDFNEDGYMDLAVYAANNQPLLDAQVFLFQNSGVATQPFSSAARVSIAGTHALATHEASNWGALTTYDFDHDGYMDLWALGNRGVLLRLSGASGFQLEGASFVGVIDSLPDAFDIARIDFNRDGYMDLAVASRLLGWPPRIFPAGDRGILLRDPGTPKIFTPSETILGINQDPFRPFVPAMGTSQSVGLIKGSPTASEYVDDRYVTHPSVFAQAVNGHLVENLEAVIVSSQFVPDPVPEETFWEVARDSLHGGSCNSEFCDLGTRIQVKGRNVETRDTSWIWVDHGTPPGTIVNSKAAVIMSRKGGVQSRHIFVHGLDGRLWELEQVAGTEQWIDHGMAPPLDGPATGARAPLVASPTAIVAPVRGGGGLIEVFSLDSNGRLNRFSRYLQPESSQWDSLGRIGAGNCIGKVGVLGEGGPQAISWVEGSIRHVEVFVVSGGGDLFSWRDNVWQDNWVPYRWQGLTYHPSSQPVPCASNGEVGAFIPLFEPRGTPSAVAFAKPDGSVVRVVVARSQSGQILEATITGDGPVTAAHSFMPAIGQSWNFIRPEGDKVSWRAFDTPFTGGFDSSKSVIASDPLVVMSERSHLTLLALTNRRQLNILQKSLRWSDNAAWSWAEAPFTRGALEGNLVEPRLVGTPAMTPDANVYAVREDGMLRVGVPKLQPCPYKPEICFFGCVVLDPGMCVTPPDGSFWRPEPHAPPGVADVLLHKAAELGKCSNTVLVDSIFPQWAPVDVVRTVDAAVLYADDALKMKGYNAEILRTIQGTVVASHISALDNPINHTIDDDSNAVPRVHHDWNIVIAPDAAYQGMLSDANIIEGGTMELEWEVGTGGAEAWIAPSVGDRVSVRGRFIFDCGHPPFKTEIHPISALAVIRGNDVKLRMSNKGGLTWFQPKDPNLLEEDRCDVTDAFEDIEKDPAKLIDFVDAEFARGACTTRFDLKALVKAKPNGVLNTCYGEYGHSLKDMFLPSGGEDLSFRMPSGEVTHSGFDFFGGGDPAPEGMTFVVPAADMPEVPTNAELHTRRSDAPPKRKFEVCFEVGMNKQHDDKGPWLPYVEPILSRLICEAHDSDDDIVMYVTAGGETAHYNVTGTTCVTTTVDVGQTLAVSSQGFECDLSCGERQDDDFIASPNDRIGTVRAVFGPNENFGAPTESSGAPRLNGQPKVYKFVSQPDLATARSRKFSNRDYTLTVKIWERAL